MLFHIDVPAKAATPVPEATYSGLGLRERYDIQEWVLATPQLLGEDLLVITTEYDRFNRTSERLDILALDEDGKLVVVELKRTAVASSADLQALRYAAYCSAWTLDDIAAERARYLSPPGGGEPVSSERARHEILAFAPRLEAEGLDDKPRIILAAQEFPPEILTTVYWLRSFLLDISCVRLVPYQAGDQLFVHSSVLIPLPEAKDFLIQRERKDAEDSVRERIAQTPDEFIAKLAPDVRRLVERVRGWIIDRGDVDEKVWGTWIGYRARSDRAWLTWISPKRNGLHVGLPPEAHASPDLQVKRTKYGWLEARILSDRDVEEVERLLATDYGVRHMTLGGNRPSEAVAEESAS